MATEIRTLLGNNPALVAAAALGSEDEAWKLLIDLHNGAEPPADLIIGDWCSLDIYLRGQIWDSTITPALFPVYEELQSSIRHAYAELKYGDAKKKLSAQEREALEVVIKITGGSANQRGSIDLTELAIAAFTSATDFMTPKQKLSFLLLVLLGIFGSVIYGYHLEHVREIRQIETKSADMKEALKTVNFVSHEDTEKIRVFGEVLKESQANASLQKDLDSLHNYMLKSATRADESTINGISLSKDVAKELVKSGKTKAVPEQINGDFAVLNLDWVNNTITLRRLSDETVVTASFDLSYFSEESRDLIMRTEWRKENSQYLSANINARRAASKIVSAELVKVSHSAFVHDKE